MRLFFYITFLSVMVSYSQSCEDYYLGYFLDEDTVSGNKTYIKRTDKFQYEISGQLAVKQKVVWEDNCSYTLYFLCGNEKWLGYSNKKIDEIPLNVKITQVKFDGYNQESNFSGEEVIYKSNLIKIFDSNVKRLIDAYIEKTQWSNCEDDDKNDGNGW